MRVEWMVLMVFTIGSTGARRYQKKIHQQLQTSLSEIDGGSAHFGSGLEADRHHKQYQQHDPASDIMDSRHIKPSNKNEVARTDMPYFVDPIANVTVALGRDAIFPCVANNLKEHKVAWLREETHSLLSIHDKVITRNYRISLTQAADKHWTLKVGQVQESDTGWYMCQINTDPMLYQKAYLRVVTPPHIIDEESSSDLDVREGENVTLVCRTHGTPEPSVTWRREDGGPVAVSNVHRVNSVDGEVLFIQRATRLHMGHYLCIASNGVPPIVSKRISVGVHFPPRVLVPHQLIGIMQGQEAVLTCHAEVYPKAIVYWTTDNGRIISLGGRFSAHVTESEFKISMVLRISPVNDSDFRKYKCFIRNSMGEAEGSILLQETSAARGESRPREIYTTTAATVWRERKTVTAETSNPPNQLTRTVDHTSYPSTFESSTAQQLRTTPVLLYVMLLCYLLSSRL